MTREAELRARLRGRRLRGKSAQRASRYTHYRPSRLRRLLTLFLRAAFKVTMRLEIVGLEHFPRSGACIVMINHIAFLDPVIVCGAFPRPREKSSAWPRPLGNQRRKRMTDSRTRRSA